MFKAIICALFGHDLGSSCISRKSCNGLYGGTTIEVKTCKRCGKAILIKK